ncbi:hypothetical protein TNCV_872611 [Trichonephila clavipes]|nr:hypothetical protein TNCV_872611 [Trichonephila clavipes]
MLSSAVLRLQERKCGKFKGSLYYCKDISTRRLKYPPTSCGSLENTFTILFYHILDTLVVSLSICTYWFVLEVSFKKTTIDSTAQTTPSVSGWINGKWNGTGSYSQTSHAFFCPMIPYRKVTPTCDQV